jgi:hypothetical protein
MIFNKVKVREIRGGDFEMNIRANGERLEKAQGFRYSKINHLIRYLQGTNNAGLIDELVKDSELTAFCVGKRIRIDGKIIKIGKREYPVYDIKKVTINTEGSMAIYDKSDRKICGTLWLNVGEKNIELFCVWVRKNSIQVEVKSGKGELVFQYLFLCIVILTIFILSLTGCNNSDSSSDLEETSTKVSVTNNNDISVSYDKLIPDDTEESLLDAAIAYLKSINRIADVAAREEHNGNLLTDLVSDTDLILELTKDETYSLYPEWTGTQERVENDIRYIYQTEYNEVLQQIIFSKIIFDTNEIIEQYVIDMES